MVLLPFVGRQPDLARLDAEWARVRQGAARFVTLRGRRQVGKSRLVTEWVTSSGAPYVYYQARGLAPDAELAEFAQAVAASSLPLADAVAEGLRFDTWEAALGAIADSAERSPIVLVFDELPYLVRRDDAFEGQLQAAWDRRLQKASVFLIAIGSDLAMMEALESHDRPLYGRVNAALRLDPLGVAATADLLGVGGAGVFDDYLVTGGLPRLLAERRAFDDLDTFLEHATADDSNPLVQAGYRALTAEFPPTSSAAAVLSAIGAGNRTFTSIAQASGLGHTTVASTLDILTAKRVVDSATPLAAPAPTKLRRYWVADSYLRFWLRFIGPHLEDVSRGRGDLLQEAIASGWESYRGVAIEPEIRSILERAVPLDGFGAARRLGGFWSRTSQVEVDIVGVTGTRPERVEVLGSVKWRRAPLTSSDAAALDRAADRIPGTDSETRRVAVSRAGVDADAEVDRVIIPPDLIELDRRR